jgi:nifR3 family TIM-barrel protein
MEDVSDIAFRLICRELGADVVYTEFASSEGLVRDAEKTWNKIRVCDTERPVAVQIFGGVEASMEAAAARAEEAGPDFIDINCGCWVKKVAMREMGAGLLRDLGRFEAVVRAVMRGTRLPVTVKTRLGWDGASINILDVARMLEDCGVAALAVHCRTRDMGHKGQADWRWLERLKHTVSIPIIGNGDLTTPEDVRRMFETGCDGAMVGRGAIHNPWLFAQTKHYLATGELLPAPGIEERIALCRKHLTLAVEHKGERRGVVDFRRHLNTYLKGMPNVARLRAELHEHRDAAPIFERMDRFREECLARTAA